MRTGFRLSYQFPISVCVAKYWNKKFFACLNVGLAFHYISVSYFLDILDTNFLLDSGFISIFTNSPSCLKLSCFLWSTHIFTFEKVQHIIVLVLVVLVSYVKIHHQIKINHKYLPLCYFLSILYFVKHFIALMVKCWIFLVRIFLLHL